MRFDPCVQQRVGGSGIEAQCNVVEQRNVGNAAKVYHYSWIVTAKYGLIESRGQRCTLAPTSHICTSKITNGVDSSAVRNHTPVAQL